MIEMRRLKNVIFIQTILNFVLSRKIIKIDSVLEIHAPLKKLKKE